MKSPALLIIAAVALAALASPLFAGGAVKRDHTTEVGGRKVAPFPASDSSVVENQRLAGRATG